MLQRAMIEGRRKYSYNCPVARCDDWMIACRERPSREYEICPRKFAEVCHFDGETVLIKTRLFKDKGEGYCRSEAAIESFQREVLQICDEVRSSWTFTRDTSRLHQQGSGEDEEIESESSDHLTTPSRKSRSL